MTESQRCMLECVQLWEGDGWAPIELEFCSRRTTAHFPTRFEESICKRVIDALVKSGMVVVGEDGPELTEAGRSALLTEPHEESAGGEP